MTNTRHVPCRTTSRRPIDMVGARFGRLVVVSMAPMIGAVRRWRCVCDCGGKKTARGGDLRGGGTMSCGCLRDETNRLLARPVHGHSRNNRTPTYISWCQMRQRCRPNAWCARWYAAKGVAVCARWGQFADFLADMGERPTGTSLDRIDGSRGYEPGNCRWADTSVQANNRDGVVMVTAFGETKTVRQWSRDPRCAVGWTSLLRRIRIGIDHEAAVTAPPADRWGHERSAKTMAKFRRRVRS